MDRKRCLKYEWRTVATCYRFSGVVRSEGCSPLEPIMREMEGVAGQEVYCSEDLILRVVGRKG